MYYLVTNTDYYSMTHESSVSLFKDGKLIDFIEEERLSKNKHSLCENPDRSIIEILHRNGLRIEDIDYTNLDDNIIKKIFFYANKVPQQFQYCKQRCHHDCHAADSFYKSRFDNAAMLVIDGSDCMQYSITFGEIDRLNIKRFKRIPVHFSLGNFYSAATSWVGMGDNSEGKFMGLSSYGNDLGIRILYFDKKNCSIYFNPELEIDEIKPWMEEEYYRIFTKLFYPYTWRNSDMDVMNYKDFAATIQTNYNELVVDMANWLYDNTEYKENLILGGGCIQNIIGNEAICRQTKFKKVYCSSTPHDAGGSFGDACIMIRDSGEEIEYLSDKQIVFSKKKYTYDEYKFASQLYTIEDISEDKIIEKLKNNEVIGWFQEGSEYGPRALGHRSLLASPKYKNMADIVNKIKHREKWRPLAPIIPEELFEDVIETNGNLSLYQFMLRNSPIKEEWKSNIPAVCHVDGTTRAQLLKRNTNSILYDLIMKFYKETGIPCLINTSLNDAGMSIVETPQDLIRYFDKSSFDIIWDGKWITYKT